MNILSSSLEKNYHTEHWAGVGKDGWWCEVSELTQCWSQGQLLVIANTILPLTINSDTSSLPGNWEISLFDDWHYAGIGYWAVTNRMQHQSVTGPAPALTLPAGEEGRGGWINSLQSPGCRAETSQTINHHAIARKLLSSICSTMHGSFCKVVFNIQ